MEFGDYENILFTIENEHRAHGRDEKCFWYARCVDQYHNFGENKNNYLDH